MIQPTNHDCVESEEDSAQYENQNKQNEKPVQIKLP